MQMQLISLTERCLFDKKLARLTEMQTHTHTHTHTACKTTQVEVVHCISLSIFRYVSVSEMQFVYKSKEFYYQNVSDL